MKGVAVVILPARAMPAAALSTASNKNTPLAARHRLLSEAASQNVAMTQGATGPQELGATSFLQSGHYPGRQSTTENTCWSELQVKLNLCLTITPHHRVDRRVAWGRRPGESLWQTGLRQKSSVP